MQLLRDLIGSSDITLSVCFIILQCDYFALIHDSQLKTALKDPPFNLRGTKKNIKITVSWGLKNVKKKDKMNEKEEARLILEAINEKQQFSRSLSMT